MSLINVKYRAETGLGAFIVLRDVDKSVVATFTDLNSFQVVTGAQSIDDYNDRPVRFKMIKREH